MSESQREYPFRLRYPLARDQRQAHLGEITDPGTLLPMEQEVLDALRNAGYDMSIDNIDTVVPVPTLYLAYLRYVGNDSDAERNMQNCRTLNEREFGVALNVVYAIPHTLHELMLADFRGEIEVPGIRTIVTRQPKFRCRVRVDGQIVLAVPGMTGPGQLPRRTRGRPSRVRQKEAEKVTTPPPETGAVDLTKIEERIREARKLGFQQAMEIRQAEIDQRKQERETKRQQRQRRENLKHAKPARIRLGKPRETS